MRRILVFVASVVLLVSLADSFTVEVPSQKRIGEFTSGGMEFDFQPETHRPYHFVLGVPGTSEKPPHFRGVLEFRDPEGKVETVLITSEAVQACNWLQDSSVSGIILAWSSPQQFSELLRRGTAYRVRVSLTDPLPAGCSLWFQSMNHVRLITQRNA